MVWCGVCVVWCVSVCGVCVCGVVCVILWLVGKSWHNDHGPVDYP